MSATMAADWIKKLDHSDFRLNSWRNHPDTPTAWVKDLHHGDAGVRAAAARMLGGLGAPAEVAVPRLTELLGDPDRSVRSAASHALQEIARARTTAPAAASPLGFVLAVLGGLLLLGLGLLAGLLIP